MFWRARVRHVVLTILLLVVSSTMGASARSADDIDALNKQAVQLYGEGRYAEATAVARQALKLAERMLGEEHPATLLSRSFYLNLLETPVGTVI